MWNEQKKCIYFYECTKIKRFRITIQSHTLGVCENVDGGCFVVRTMYVRTFYLFLLHFFLVASLAPFFQHLIHFTCLSWLWASFSITAVSRYLVCFLCSCTFSSRSFYFSHCRCRFFFCFSLFAVLCDSFILFLCSWVTLLFLLSFLLVCLIIFHKYVSHAR